MRALKTPLYMDRMRTKRRSATCLQHARTRRLNPTHIPSPPQAGAAEPWGLLLAGGHGGSLGPAQAQAQAQPHTDDVSPRTVQETSLDVSLSGSGSGASLSLSGGSGASGASGSSGRSSRSAAAVAGAEAKLAEVGCGCLWEGGEGDCLVPVGSEWSIRRSIPRPRLATHPVMSTDPSFVNATSTHRRKGSWRHWRSSCGRPRPRGARWRRPRGRR